MDSAPWSESVSQ